MGQKKWCAGGVKNTQFYESFTSGEESYSLFDCVYLIAKGMSEPYIGKILKIWEEGDGKRKVEILWFFCPSEISNYLQDHNISEKEIFLASGVGVGLTDINPLEAIAAKCSVVCTSEDVQNPQASREACENAHFIFSHTFDVGKLTISDIFPDKIAGIEVKYLLNRNGFDRKGKEHVGETGGLDGSILLEPKTVLSKDKPSKKLTLGNNFRKSIDVLQRNKNVAGAKMVFQTSNEVDSDRCSTQLHKGNSDNIMLCEKKFKSSDESLQKVPPVVSVKKNTEAEHQIVEMTRRPDVDRSKWFKELPWVVRLSKANEQGTLVFLEYFDRSLTSTDIQDILFHTFNQSWTAKVIPCLPPYHSPHYGQAYAIFKTADAADDATRRINIGCLMQPNGSVFIASKGMLPKLPKATKHPGHITIRTKQMQRGEMRKAVSTSHCSQDGTIEYDLAMDWVLMQEIAVDSFIRLYKGHGDVMEEVSKNLKTGILSPEKTALNSHF